MKIKKVITVPPKKNVLACDFDNIVLDFDWFMVKNFLVKIC